MDKSATEQLVLALDPDEVDRLIKVQTELSRDGARKVAASVERAIEYETFSFRELAEFAKERGQTVQVAGKSFKQFYRGLMSFNALPLVESSEAERVQARRERRRYEQDREGMAFKLGHLAVVLARPDLVTEDQYTQLLRDYQHQRLLGALVKQSTST